MLQGQIWRDSLPVDSTGNLIQIEKLVLGGLEPGTSDQWNLNLLELMAFATPKCASAAHQPILSTRFCQS